MTEYSHLPDPPVPAGCSMGDNDYFPLYFDRLRGSRWWRRASDLCRARNVMLWGEAYKATPAGSLPDDDDELAEAAGFGFDVDGFLSAKGEIMGPWILCNDGRWYHPTVCEVVLDTWEKTSEARRQARVKKAEQRARLKSKTRPVPAKSPPVPRDNDAGPQGQGDLSLGTAPLGDACPPQSFFDKEKEILGSNEPVASASPSATVGALALPLEEPVRVVGEPWDRDIDFTRFWDMAPIAMRKRAKSKAKVWPEWAKARKRTLPSAIIAGFARYIAEDQDLPRSGGPGLHLWLRDRTWEQWIAQAAGDVTAAWGDAQWMVALRMWREDNSWSDEFGPPPGAPGCRAPSRLLVNPAPPSAVA